MAARLLNIKIKIPPLGRTILQRPLLHENLHRSLMDGNYFTRQLTLISAPAGFGKTTLARQFIADRKELSAWFSIDSGDNERGRFWRYMISSLQAIKKDLGKGTLEMEESAIQAADAEETAEMFLAPLLNDLLEMDELIMMVLDDYHLIDNSVINNDMAFFIENLPPTLHLVVTTRSEPPWPLARWMARGHMIDVRQKNLRFSLDESSAFFRKIKGCKLENSDIKMLYGKTEGWITGLQLAAISLTNTENIKSFIDTFAGNSRHVFHFLSDEVLSSQPDVIREFLLKTSFLERFCAPLCCAVTGNQNSTELIKMLEASNLFLTPLDEQERWYRYHPLFADLLLHHLNKCGPEILKELHEKAAAWFLEEDEPGEALRHSLKAGNLVQSASLLDENLDQILLTEGALLIIECLDAFPDEVLKEYPRLAVHKAWFLMVQRGKEASLQPLELADSLAANVDSDVSNFQGMLSVVKAYYSIYNHDFKSALHEAEKALKLLPEDSYYWRAKVGIISGDARLFTGNPKGAYPYYCDAKHNNQAYGNSYLVISAGFKIATTLCYLGRLDESEKITDELLELAEDERLNNAPRVGLLWTLKGELARERGKLAEAEDYIDKGLLISEPEKPSFSWNSLFKTALFFSKKDYQSALETIDTIKKLHRKYALPDFILLPATAWKARILLAQGKAIRAEEELSQPGILPEAKEIKGGLEFGFLVLCRLLIVKAKDYTEAARLIDLVEKVSRAGENYRVLMETLLLKAVVQERSGYLEKAVKTLKKVLEKAFNAGYYRLFLDEGEVLSSIFKRLIAELDSRSIETAAEIETYARSIYRDLLFVEEDQDRFEKGLTHDSSTTTGQSDLERQYAPAGKTLPGATVPVEKLSARELEVLMLLGRGMSNQQIAEKLYLSPGTVKWHASNTYGKLEVRSRAEAVAVARQLKLIT
jgi:LuxR family maltose regulon positive regulatory protein